MKLKLSNTEAVAEISPEDFDRISKIKWHLSNKGYVVGSEPVTNKTIRLHRYLLSVPSGLVVDHIDGNKLNNKRQNLRICTQAQNTRNSIKRKDGRSQYKGVSWNKQRNKWSVRIWTPKGRKYVGFYNSEEAAAIAYDQAASDYFLEFARLNFKDLLPKVDRPTAKAFREILVELINAQQLFPAFVNAHQAYATLLEEVDELWAEIKKKQGSEGRPEAIRREAIQVAAMALRLILDTTDPSKPAYNK